MGPLGTPLGVLRTPLIQNFLLLALIFVTGFASLGWLITPAHSFVFDDYSHLLNVSSASVSDYLSFKPKQIYNDRPVGLLVVRLLFQEFKLTATGYNFVMLLLHCANACLLMLLVRSVFAENSAASEQLQQSKRKTDVPVCAAIIFLLWPTSGLASWWISAIFDLLGCTWTLLLALLVSRCWNERKYLTANSLAAFIVFCLALRTKEMTVTAPFLILAILLIFAQFNSSVLRLHRAHITLCLTLCLIALFYVRILFQADQSGGDVQQATSPYFIHFSLPTMMTSLVRYLSLYVDWQRPGFSAQDSTDHFHAGALTLIAVLLFAGLLLRIPRLQKFLPDFAVDPSYQLLRAFAATSLLGVAALGPVLPMQNMQHSLYLYIPSLFFATALACLFRFTISFQSRLGLKSTVANACSFALLLIGMVMAQTSSGAQVRKQSWIRLAAEDSRSISTFNEIYRKSPEQLSYVVYGATEGYSVFSYGPGNALRLFVNPDLNFRVASGACPAKQPSTGQERSLCLCADRSIRLSDAASCLARDN